MQNMFIPYPNFCKKFDCDTILFNNMINFCIFRVKNINNVFILYNTYFCYIKNEDIQLNLYPDWKFIE